MTRLILLSLMLALPASAVDASTLVAVLDPVSLDGPNAFDLGGTFGGITGVSMRVVGNGGAICYSCSDIDDTIHHVFAGYDASVVMDDAYRASYRPDIGTPYDVVVDVLPPAGTEDWSALEDGSVVLTVTLTSTGAPGPRCTYGFLCGETFTLERIEMTITADVVVPTAPTTWSRIKATYR